MTAPDEIISDAEVLHVHGNANFGTMAPRAVIADGVLKYAYGYSSGHTQMCILIEHGLIRKPRPGKYYSTLTKRGQAYFRAAWPIAEFRRDPAVIAAPPEVQAMLADALERAVEIVPQGWCLENTKHKEVDVDLGVAIQSVILALIPADHAAALAARDERIRREERERCAQILADQPRDEPMEYYIATIRAELEGK